MRTSPPDWSSLRTKLARTPAHVRKLSPVRRVECLIVLDERQAWTTHLTTAKSISMLRREIECLYPNARQIALEVMS